MELNEDVARQIFETTTGIDVADTETVMHLFALEIVHAGWRNGPIEDVHADPASPLTDGVMLRLNTFLSSVALEVTDGWLEGIGDLQSLTVDELDALLVDLEEALLDRELVLPIGGSIVDVSGAEAEEVQGRLLDVLGATHEVAEKHSALTAVLIRAATAPRYWWGGPEWPAKADRFVDVLGQPEDPHWDRVRHILDGEVPAEVRDHECLRDALQNHPWTLSTAACEWMVSASIEYVRPERD
ncbi:hypothetical protein [Agromyces humi]|uniref:hypothetical protein n=1 Tax=Agromyces humi TaxID=1766800 RepID=UPI00135C70F8|nr:hypothetical protein [Agromyces humi]